MANSNNININDFRKTFINPSYLWRSDNSRGIIWSQDINWGDISSSIGTLNSLTIIQKLEEILSSLSSLEERVNQLEQQYETPQVPDATAIISSTNLIRRRTNNITTLTWELGSVPSTITSGEIGILNKGEVKATYSGHINEDTTIITANIQGELEIISTNENVVTIGTVNKNGTTVITGINEGSSRIIVTDNNNVVNSFDVYVGNEALIDDVTNEAIFTASAGTISGNTITAPTVQSNTEVIITVSYNGVTASTQKVYTATPAAPAETYYWYVGQTPVDDTNYTSISSSVTEIPTSTDVTLNTDDYLYIVAPKTKTVTVLDANTQGVVNIKTYNSETHTFTYAETFVDDYKIYKSAQPCVGPFIINISDTNI